VEAHLHGRNSVGTDISSLAVFVAQVKTTLLAEIDLHEIRKWTDSLGESLNLHTPAKRDVLWIQLGYQRNISTKKTWPIRKTVELTLSKLPDLARESQRQFVRCALLKTAQWAVDCRTDVPSASELRLQFRAFLDEMIEGARHYAMAVAAYPNRDHRVVCLHRSVEGLESESIWKQIPRPKLILTSPPYPGVHVVYHRWQIHGRRETPAPFWIAGTLDGHGESFYTFGDRKRHNLTNYYTQAQTAFRSLALVAAADTIIVQMVAFSDLRWQLPRYLEVMNVAGFQEIKFDEWSNAADGRLWRAVPNRKWYASQRGAIGASKEVVLFHQLAR
jgi:hypothetical protein